MELDVRQIVSQLGVNVATKKLVLQEYCALKGLRVLSPKEKKRIFQVLKSIVEELIANPDACIYVKESKDNSGVESDDNHCGAASDVAKGTNMSDSPKNGSLCKEDCIATMQTVESRLDDGKENEGSTSSDWDQKCMESSRHLELKDMSHSLAEQKNVKSLLTKPKRRFKRMKSKEVRDSILNSDNADISSGGDFSSPGTTPRKLKNTIVESPLVKAKVTKRRRILSDSESDSGIDYPLTSKNKSNSDNQQKHEHSSKSDSDSNVLACHEERDNRKCIEFGTDGSDIPDSDLEMDNCLDSKSGRQSYKRNISECKVMLDDFVGKKSKSATKDDEFKPTSKSGEKRRLSQCSTSSLDSLSEDSCHEPSLSKASKTSSSHASSGKVKVKTKSSRSQKVDSDSKALKNLRSICKFIGLGLQNKLKDCNTDKEKVARIKELLRDRGLEGRPSMANAEQYNLERELKELGGLVADSDTKAARKRSCRDDFFSRRTRDTSPVTPGAASDHFSHMTDIFCADDSSD